MGDDEEGSHNSSSGRQRRRRRRSFMDVFHGGRILSTTDCRQIVASYRIEWRDEFLTPLPIQMTLQRIFNNLQNCHEKALALAVVKGNKNNKNNSNSNSNSTIPPPLFCSDLMFQQRIASMIHRSSPEMAIVLLSRVVQELPIVLSSDLLRAFQLLTL